MNWQQIGKHAKQTLKMDAWKWMLQDYCKKINFDFVGRSSKLENNCNANFQLNKIACVCLYLRVCKSCVCLCLRLCKSCIFVFARVCILGFDLDCNTCVWVGVVCKIYIRHCRMSTIVPLVPFHPVFVFLLSFVFVFYTVAVQFNFYFYSRVYLYFVQFFSIVLFSIHVVTDMLFNSLYYSATSIILFILYF